MKSTAKNIYSVVQAITVFTILIFVFILLGVFDCPYYRPLPGNNMPCNKLQLYPRYHGYYTSPEAKLRTSVNGDIL